jgi:cold shock CspA family protein
LSATAPHGPGGPASTARAGLDGRPTFGTVSAFDDHRGLGTVTDDRGREWPFHCTAIADGSRTIEVGTAVVFRPAPGHLGRMEAVEVQQVGSSGTGRGRPD